MATDPFLVLSARADGAVHDSDMVSGRPDGTYSTRVPLAQSIQPMADTDHDVTGAAPIVGTAVTGQPMVSENDVQPDVKPIQKLDDTRHKLPRGER